MSSTKRTLLPWNTFRLKGEANRINVIHSIEELCQCWQESQRSNEPVLLLGEGSNVLFIDDFAGQVIINRIKGIQVTEISDAWLLHVGAGENWHQLVEYTLSRGYAGLENLALIPGCVGTAPVQNVGAYDVEISQVCEYVDIVHLPDGKRRRMSASDCKFGYRDSVFKHHYRDQYAIVGLGLRLAKIWTPVLTYGDLGRLDKHSVTPRQVFDAVCQIRSSKLPNPSICGNAGSFFKSPVISAELAATLRETYPTIPCYAQSSGEVKIPAAWLIDQCQLKGFQFGGAAVYHKQAVVLINAGNASGKDFVALARTIRQRVGTKFNLWLEPEVRFIGVYGELDAVKVIA